MDALEEFTGSNDHNTLIVKGKRTKRRQRLSSPFGVVVMTSSSSSGGGDGTGGGEGRRDGNFSITSPTTSGEFSTTTQEEEDMANCLILLARGGPKQVEEEGNFINLSSRQFTEISTTTAAATGKAGFYVYECKTCNRTFPSFQALGGHRASHKRPKTMTLNHPSDHDHENEELIFNKIISQTVPIQIPNKASPNKTKVHECSICGSEFSSGQALGGHMRRHRTVSNTQITMNIDTSSVDELREEEKPRHFLPLDLNLPAPEDDHHHSKFQFTANQQCIVFSAPALVHCHY